MIKFKIVLICLMIISCSSSNQLVRINNNSMILLTSLNRFNISVSKEELINEAEKLVNKKFKTVLDKKIIAKSGNKHDYTSRAIYYWPQKVLLKSNHVEEKWEFRDGQINKESLELTDHNNYYTMLDAVKKLSLAYYYTNNNKYAQKCVHLIEEWFINEKTRMNPNFNYAQAIPGKNNGTPSGIIDSRGIMWVIDAVNLIKDSESWTNEYTNKFNEWINKLFSWLLNSDFGKLESQSKNNHGTFYDLQIIKLSSYLGKNNITENFIDSVKIKRIEKQIKPNGFQPEEMRRTKSELYAVFNLSALLNLAIIAKAYNENLWNFKTKDSGSIEDAIDYLLKTSPDTKNLMRILPLANELSNGKYDKELNKIKQKYDHFDLTEMYFVN